MDDAFQPARGIAHPHLQTLFAFLARPRTGPEVRRRELDTADGDFLEVDILDAPASAPHLLVLHGLEGSSRAGYVRAVLRDAKRRGWGAWALNFRSCGPTMNRTLRIYSSGESEDPRAVLGAMRASGVNGPLLGIGFSLGANALLKLLAEDGVESPLTAAAAVSTPFDLERSARSIDAQGGVGAVYRMAFLLSLKRKALAKASAHPGALDASAIRAARSLVAFDDAVTSRLYGYRDAVDYYRQCSSGPMLPRIARPTLLLSSSDDPMVPAAALPDRATLPPHVTLEVTPSGGHVGFVSGDLLHPTFWAERRALDFLEARLPAPLASK